MASVVNRIRKVGTTLWDHKKKTAFGCFLLFLGADYAAKWSRNSKIRAAYARLAVKYGEQTISAEDRPRRVTVLANVTANDRACYDNFTKNALPLLNLAGIQVDIIKADSESQLESLAAALDHQEADAIYVVGGDGTIGRVVTGIFRNRDQSILPIGVFPGGYDTLTLKRLVPAVFTQTEDVRRFCESAMALIEDQKQSVAAFEYKMEGSDEEQKPLYGIGDVGAGWFRHIEDKRKKLWYFGGLKRRWAYIWEMVKRSPEDMSISVEYEEHCSGCRRCRPPVIVEQPQWRWWHILTGTPRIQPPAPMKDYSQIENEKCGTTHQAQISGSDLIVENEQEENSSRLHLRIGGTNAGRFGVISDGMSRCSSGVVGTSTRDDFYSTDLVANRFRLQFDKFPEFLSKIYVSSDSSELKEGQAVNISRTDKRMEMFLPAALRIDTATL